MTNKKHYKLSKHAGDFIYDDHLLDLLNAAPPAPARVRDIIAKSLEKNTLTIEETAALLRVRDEELTREIQEAAKKLKK